MEIEIGMEKEDKEKKGYDEYELKDACHTLMRAEEIKADKELMAAVKPMLSKKAQAIKKISSFSELKQVAKERIKEIEKKDME